MKTLKELIGRKKTVKLVTGLNRYSKKQTIPVLGKLPSKKIREGRNYSDWGLDLGLRNEEITYKKIEEIKLESYDLFMIDGILYLKGIDY